MKWETKIIFTKISFLGLPRSSWDQKFDFQRNPHFWSEKILFSEKNIRKSQQIIFLNIRNYFWYFSRPFLAFTANRYFSTPKMAVSDPLPKSKGSTLRASISTTRWSLIENLDILKYKICISFECFWFEPNRRTGSFWTRPAIKKYIFCRSGLFQA